MSFDPDNGNLSLAYPTTKSIKGRYMEINHNAQLNYPKGVNIRITPFADYCINDNTISVHHLASTPVGTPITIQITPKWYAININMLLWILYFG